MLTPEHQAGIPARLRIALEHPQIRTFVDMRPPQPAIAPAEDDVAGAAIPQ
ncbi:MAG: hypothetical protein ACYDHD_10310 [Vulcanimicrobiaceae bacterium]